MIVSNNLMEILNITNGYFISKIIEEFLLIVYIHVQSYVGQHV